MIMAVVLVAATCSGGPSEPVWSNSSEGATVSLGYVPDGFSFVGVEELVGMGADDAVAVSYVFENEDGSERFSVAWQQPRFTPGAVLGVGRERDGRLFGVSDHGWLHRISWEEQCAGILVESTRVESGPLVDIDTLWRIVWEITYVPDEAPSCPEPWGRFQGDWEFFGGVSTVEFTGDFVVDLPWYRWRLGPMEITLTSGEVLEVPEGSNRFDWCVGIPPDVWLREDDGCWIAGAYDEQGRVSGWETFTPHRRFRTFKLPVIEDVLDGAVVVRGYPIPLADDVEINLECCPDDVQTLEDMIGGVGPMFDAERGEAIFFGCYCEA
jgi:hypothetical protein